MEIINVTAKSNPNTTAGEIASYIRTEGTASLEAVGAGAVNVAVKAIIIARGFMEPVGIDLVCVPSFIETKIDGEERMAVRFLVQTK
jgi:Uncharacterized protein conserved in bacteria